MRYYDPCEQKRLTAATLTTCTRSSVDRALDCGSKGRRFDPSRVRHYSLSFSGCFSLEKLFLLFQKPPAVATKTTRSYALDPGSNTFHCQDLTHLKCSNRVATKLFTKGLPFHNSPRKRSHNRPLPHLLFTDRKKRDLYVYWTKK